MFLSQESLAKVNEVRDRHISAIHSCLNAFNGVIDPIGYSIRFYEDVDPKSAYQILTRSDQGWYTTESCDTLDLAIKKISDLEAYQVLMKDC